MNFIDITLAKHRCGQTLTCPAVFKSDDGTYHIIGKRIDSSEAHVKDRVAPEEIVAEVPGELLEEAIQAELQKRATRL